MPYRDDLEARAELCEKAIAERDDITAKYEKLKKSGVRFPMGTNSKTLVGTHIIITVAALTIAGWHGAMIAGCSTGNRSESEEVVPAEPPDHLTLTTESPVIIRETERRPTIFVLNEPRVVEIRADVPQSSVYNDGRRTYLEIRDSRVGWTPIAEGRDSVFASLTPGRYSVRISYISNWSHSQARATIHMRTYIPEP